MGFFINFTLMAKKKYISKNPDLERYILVRGKEGDHLRRKRGTVTKAVINESFAENARDTGSTEAKQIMKKLEPFTRNCFGRKQVYLSALLRKAKKETGKMDYSFLMRWELMKDYPLFDLYIGQYKVKKKKNSVDIRIALEKGNIFKRTPGATHYYFEAILIHGDACIPGDLRSDYDRSPLYKYDFSLTGKERETFYTLSLVIPDNRPYIVFLKVGCKDGKKDSSHAKNYGVKVVDVGGTRVNGDAVTLRSRD